MRWAAMNMLGAGAWCLGLLYAKAPQLVALGGVDGIEHRMPAALALTATGAAILLWTNLRSA